jgi:hypothetical protein
LRRSEFYIVEEDRQRSKARNPKANYAVRQLSVNGIADSRAGRSGEGHSYRWLKLRRVVPPETPLLVVQQSTPSFLILALGSASVEEYEVPPRFVRRTHRRTNHPGVGEPVSNAIITLTTDYGTNDHLVGTLKGVILKINPEATIVDITHGVAPYDLLDGALAIGSAYAYFPPRTIHIVVVDPGVGTERRPLLVSGDNQYFVAPDNGVLSLVYERNTNVVVRNATAEHYYLQPVSNTFHGRDIFAPIAAWLSKGWQTAAMGEEIQDYKKFDMPKQKSINGEVKSVVMR